MAIGILKGGSDVVMGAEQIPDGQEGIKSAETGGIESIGDYSRPGVGIFAGNDDGEVIHHISCPDAVDCVQGMVVVILGGHLGGGVEDNGANLDVGGSETNYSAGRASPAGSHRE